MAGQTGFAVRASFNLDLLGGGGWVTTLFSLSFPICPLADGLGWYTLVWR